jgi:hypothetical protein
MDEGRNYNPRPSGYELEFRERPDYVELARVQAGFARSSYVEIG